MTEELKKQIDELKADARDAIKRFHVAVTPEELRARLADTHCSVLVNEEFTIFYATPPFEKLFGYESEQLEGEHINILVPAAKRAAHAEQHLPQYAEHPERKSMTERPELRAVHQTGREFPVRIELAPLYWHGVKYFVAQVFEVK